MATTAGEPSGHDRSGFGNPAEAAYDARVLVWMDLEMTGLDPRRHTIVKIATIITDDRLEIIAEGEGRHVFFMLEGSVLLIFNPQVTDKPSPAARFPVPHHGAKGPGHACFRADGEALDAWRKRLQDAGVEIEEEITWANGARSLYFRDPAGNSLEFGEGRLWNI